MFYQLLVSSHCSILIPPENKKPFVRFLFFEGNQRGALEINELKVIVSYLLNEVRNIFAILCIVHIKH